MSTRLNHGVDQLGRGRGGVAKHAAYKNIVTPRPTLELSNIKQTSHRTKCTVQDKYLKKTGT